MLITFITSVLVHFMIVHLCYGENPAQGIDSAQHTEEIVFGEEVQEADVIVTTKPPEPLPPTPQQQSQAQPQEYQSRYG